MRIILTESLASLVQKAQQQAGMTMSNQIPSEPQLQAPRPVNEGTDLLEAFLWERGQHQD